MYWHTAESLRLAAATARLECNLSVTGVPPGARHGDRATTTATVDGCVLRRWRGRGSGHDQLRSSTVGGTEYQLVPWSLMLRTCAGVSYSVRSVATPGG